MAFKGKGTKDQDFNPINGNTSSNSSMLSPDLDIFGDEWDVADSSSADIDVFGDMWGEEESSSGDSDDKDNGETTPSTETPSSENKADGESNDNDGSNEEGTDKSQEDLDAEIKKLLWLDEEASNTVDDIKSKAQAEEASTELLNMIDSLQTQLAEKDSVINSIQKKLDVVNERLMSTVWDYEWLAISKDIIDKIDQNPKLKVLVKYFGNDNPTMKTKITSILSDLVHEVTWEDISEMISTAEKNKINSALWSSNWSYAPSAPARPADTKDEDMSYEESIDKLF